MVLFSFFHAVAFAVVLRDSIVDAALLQTRAPISTQSLNTTCNEIADSISGASNVYYPGSDEYNSDIGHYAASSTEASACTVQPGTPEDVGVVLQIVGRTNTSFAVKGGGHTFSQGYSSTTGVHISLARFQQITVGETNGVPSVALGTGLIWETVYPALDAMNLTVVGGRVSGVGIAGCILGGGLSFKTPEYGISLANILSLELVLPSGQVTTITADTNPDLFFAARGTQNNFGVITTITMKAIQQGAVWGGTNRYPITDDNLEEIIDIVDYLANNVTDPKASTVLAFNYQNNSLMLNTLLYYNGALPPPGLFDKLLAMPALVNDATTRTYADIAASTGENFTLGYRASIDHAMVLNWTRPLIKAAINMTQFYGERLLQVDPQAQIINPLEPFLPDMFQHGDPGAWPPYGVNSPALLTLASQWSWTTGSDTDSQFISAQKEFTAAFEALGDSEGQNSSNLALYSNYVIAGTPVERIFGPNLDRLQRLKAQYDPNNIMGLAGGIKIGLPTDSDPNVPDTLPATN